MSEFELKLLQVAFAFIGIALAMPTVVKGLLDLKQFDKTRRRAEAEFLLKADQFLHDPRLRSLGEKLTYAALTGDYHLTHDQRVVLVSNDDPEHAIRMYARVRRLLKIEATLRALQWKHPRLERRWWRRTLKTAGVVGYLLIAMAGFAPWLYLNFNPPTRPLSAGEISMQVLWTMYGLGIAAMCLSGTLKMSMAENLMLNWRPHPAASGNEVRNGTLESQSSSTPMMTG